MEQSPVVDIVAIGFDTGKIAIMNLLFNEQLIEFDARDPVD